MSTPLRGAPGARPAVVIFDLGGVLVDVDLERARRRWRDVSGLPERLFDVAFFDSGLKARMDRDRLEREDLELLVNRAVGSRLRGEELEAIWTACLTPREEALRLVARVAERARVGVLSDTDPFHAAFIRALPALAAGVEHWTFSFEVGRLKPDPVLYAAALRPFAVSPAEALFIDDREPNVRGAREAGLEALLFEDLEQVSNALRQRSLI